MERKQIVLEFLKDGTVRVAPAGFGGAGCRDATRFIEEALGTVVSSEDTPEAFMVENTSNGTVKT